MISKITDFTLANSFLLEKEQKIYNKTHRVSPGYFSIKNILDLKKNYTYEEDKIIFIGTIDWRMDFDLLEYVIDELSDKTFLFYYKEVFDSFQSQKKIKSLNKIGLSKWKKIKSKKNVNLIEVSNQDELAKQKIHGSLGIMPYYMNDIFNKYCHPIKFYNYFALGIPIVSVKIPNILHYQSEYVKFVDNKKEFAKEVRRLLNKKVSKKNSKWMYKQALDQTFERKTKQIEELVGKNLNL